MRTEIETIVNETLRTYILRERYRLGITMDKMSEKLAMSLRAYANIEYGVNGCSAATVILFLLETSQREQLLNELRNKLEWTNIIDETID